MKESKYNVWLNKKDNKEDVVLCYNMMTSGFASLDKKAYEFFKNIVSSENYYASNISDDDKMIFEELYNGGIILNNNANELDLLKHRFLLNTYGSRILGLTILPTLKCNFSCSYCFEGSKKKNVDISNNVINSIKDYVKERIETKQIDGLYVTWFGGEPLLQYDRIVELSEFFIEISSNKQIPYNASMISNCWLLTTEKAEKLKELRIEWIQATIDGAKDAHNRKRRTLSDKDTFEKILENISSASEIMPITLRINIDKDSSSQLDSIFKDIEQIAKYKNISIYPGLIRSDATLACKNIESNCISVQDFASLYLEFYKKAQECGFNVHWFKNSALGGCCAASQNAFVIDPDGSLSRCWSQVGIDGESYGNILNLKETFNPINYYKWILFNPFEIESCIKCDFLPICVGGCPADNIPQTTEHMKPNNEKPDKCIPEKYNLKEMLLLYYEYFQSQQAEQEQKPG